LLSISSTSSKTFYFKFKQFLSISSKIQIKMVPTKNTTTLSYIKLLYKLIQCLHHITIINTQQQGSFTKAFALKLRSLNDFVKPANSGPQIRLKIQQINRAWVDNTTNLLADHYTHSIFDLQNQIKALNLHQSIVQDLVNQTINRALRNFGSKLKSTTIKQFKQILFQISKSHNPSAPTHTPQNIPRSRPSHTNIPQTQGTRFAKGPHDPLSNFFSCQFRHKGMLFRSVEHAYQIQKALFHRGFQHLANQIGACDTAAQAKSIGRKIPSSDRWNSIKSNVVFDLLQEKWIQIPAFRNELLAVQKKGQTILHPVPDTYWGTGNGDKNGRNIFGKLLHDTLDYQTRRPRNPQNHYNTPWSKVHLGTPGPRPPTHMSVHQPNPTNTHAPINHPTQQTNKPQPTTSTLQPTTPTHQTTPKTSTQPTTPTWSKAGQPRSTLKQPPTTPIPTQNRFAPLQLLTPQPTYTQSIPHKPNKTNNHSTTTKIPAPSTKTPPSSPKPLPKSPPTTTTSVSSPNNNLPPKSPSKPSSLSSTNILGSPVYQKHFPSLPTSRSPIISTPRNSGTPRTHRSSVGTLRLAPIRSSSTPLKRTHPSPSSSPDSTPVSKRKNSGIPPKSSGSFPASVTTNKATYKKNWKWPVVREDILIIGASNLGRITSSPLDQIQIESFPGAHFQNFTDMLRLPHQNKTTNNPKQIILDIGINDRCSNVHTTAGRNLTTMVNKLADRNQSSEMYLIEINYSDQLTKQERSNLDAINKTMFELESQSERIHVIRKLHPSKFQTTPDNIHWTKNTANSMIRHWLDSLN
jgi:ribA/ribD-fused uncharacterized protein